MVIRLYKDMVEFIHFALVKLQAVRPELMAEQFYMGGDQITGDGFIDQLKRQLDTKSSDRDLVDKLVEILKLPYIDNRMSVTTLRRLREAILLPDEMRDVSRMMNEQWSCTDCGVSMQAGDLVTLKVGGRLSAYPVLQLSCLRCSEGKHVMCNGKKHRHKYGSTLSRVLGKFLREPCEMCELDAARIREQEAVSGAVQGNPTPTAVATAPGLGSPGVPFPSGEAVPTLTDSWQAFRDSLREGITSSPAAVADQRFTGDTPTASQVGRASSGSPIPAITPEQIESDRRWMQNLMMPEIRVPVPPASVGRYVDETAAPPSDPYRMVTHAPLLTRAQELRLQNQMRGGVSETLPSSPGDSYTEYFTEPEYDDDAIDEGDE